MAVTVEIPTILRTYTGGDRAVAADGATVGAVIEDLDRQHPGLRGRLVGADGALLRFVNIYVADEDVRFLGGLQAPVADGQTVTVLPAVAGGA